MFVEKIYLDILSEYSFDGNLELFSSFIMSDLDQILPKEFIDVILISKYEIMTILDLQDNEFLNPQLKEGNLRLLHNILEIYKNFFLRNFHLFSLEYSLISYICLNSLSIETINNWKNCDYDMIKNLKNKEEIILLLKSKSEIEEFFANENIIIEDDLLKIIKYVDSKALKERDLNIFIKKCERKI